MINCNQLELKLHSHFVAALGDTGGVPYDILHPVLEKYVFLHNPVVKNCMTSIPDI